MWTLIISILRFVKYCELLSMFIYILCSIFYWCVILSSMELWYKKVINIGRFCRACSDCFLFKIILGTSETSFTTETSRHIWKILLVDTIIFCWFYICPQYQFVVALILLRYSAITASLPALITFPLVFMYSCNVKS